MKLRNGDKVEITWLPNPKNNPSVKNCYIGSTGVVHDLESNGAFSLKMETSWLVAGTSYSYEIKK